MLIAWPTFNELVLIFLISAGRRLPRLLDMPLLRLIYLLVKL